MANDFNIKLSGLALEREDEVIEQLTNVIDPELGIDIVNLGLIYEVHINEEGFANVIMTLTTPMCPLADFIEADLRYVLSNLDFIEELDLELTFEPAWDISNISRFGRIALGIPDSM